MKKTPTEANLKVCPLCERQDNGAPKCRDHPPLPKRVLARFVKEERGDE